MKLETKLKNWTLGKWKKEFWKTFAIYIKKRDRNICYTCGRLTEGMNSHAGHFIPKSVGGLALYFNEDNVRCQCMNCNVNLGGNQYIYGEKLGKEKVEELRAIQRNTMLKWSKQDYLDKIDEYQDKIKQLDSSI